MQLSPYHTITHLCFGNEHTIFSCAKMKSMTEEKRTVFGVMTYIICSCICYIVNGDMMVIRYNKCVWFHTTCSFSITCQIWDIRKSFIFLDSFANHSNREHRSIALRSLPFLFANGLSLRKIIVKSLAKTCQALP